MNPDRLIQSQVSYHWTIPQGQGEYTTGRRAAQIDRSPRPLPGLAGGQHHLGPADAPQHARWAHAKGAHEIAPEEIAEAARLILREHVKLSRCDLIVATARVLGFERTGPDVRKAVSSGIEALVSSGAAVVERDAVSLARELSGEPPDRALMSVHGVGNGQIQ